MNSNHALSDITIKFGSTTPDTIAAQLTAKYGKPTMRTVQNSRDPVPDTQVSNGAEADRYEWQVGPVIISTDVPCEPSLYSIGQYRIVDDNALANPL